MSMWRKDGGWEGPFTRAAVQTWEIKAASGRSSLKHVQTGVLLPPSPVA